VVGYALFDHTEEGIRVVYDVDAFRAVGVQGNRKREATPVIEPLARAGSGRWSGWDFLETHDTPAASLRTGPTQALPLSDLLACL